MSALVDASFSYDNFQEKKCLDGHSVDKYFPSVHLSSNGQVYTNWISKQAKNAKIICGM